MIEVGKYNNLTVVKQTEDGLQLKDNEGELVCLPTKFIPKGTEIGDSLRIFVYHGNNGKKIATTQTPKITLYGFALLQVTAMTKVGAFLNWGLDKDILLPFSEQRRDLSEGRWYVVYLDIDDSGRLFATTKIEDQLQNIHITVNEGDEVEILILKKTDLGYTVIVNDEHEGLIYDNEIFTTLRVGDRMPAYVKKVREDNQLDISIQKLGFRQVIDTYSDKILQTLSAHDGFLALTDKSAPADIAAILGMSKKAFKKTIGGLYKARKISLEEDGIRLLKNTK
ncbi:S1-like domain-containing RNA-binding protein [Flavobacteriaceae bacterium F08102]|nr:S1-like domain-containing RNA-binding protein [Flavobacteriaceae bacterium F08102]